MALLDYRPLYRVRRVVETKFFQSDTSINRKFAEEDLARSGLTIEDLGVDVGANLRLVEGAMAGYTIPYYDLDGQVLVNKQDSNGLSMYRIRLKWAEFTKASRYTQPSREELARDGLPAYVPYFHPLSFKLEADHVICAEGEKKTASILKFLGLPAFGIGGCQMWRDPTGARDLHPWITDYLRRRNFNTVVIVPDGDVFRYDICKAYGTFARALESEGFKVKIINCPGKIDDLLLEWGDDAHARFGSLPAIASNDLVQSTNSLIDRYGLAFKRDSKDKPIVYQHSSNVFRLLEEHNAFPKVWRNLDNNRVMIGDDPAQPDYTEMQIANYFQHNLGFDKVNHKLIYACIQALAKQNAKSPMLEYIQKQVWDGKPRLNTWLERLWGVAPNELVTEVSAKWLISACARMAKPGTKIDWILIVVGPQGTGKTSMPGIVFKGSACTLYGDQNDKDLHMLLHSSLCAGFDELDSFSKREAGNLKAMISRNEDSFRPPYGASIEVFPRRFTLYGCGNRYEFLQHDPSGYRRYPVVEVTKLLDFAGLEAERDQLWAEAWVRYQQGKEKYWEIEGASANAEKYVIANPLEETIIGWLEAQKMSKVGTSIKNDKFYFTMSQCLRGIGRENELNNSTVTRDVAGILRALGVEQTNSKRPPVPGVPPGRYYIATIGD